MTPPFSPILENKLFCIVLLGPYPKSRCLVNQFKNVKSLSSKVIGSRFRPALALQLSLSYQAGSPGLGQGFKVYPPSAAPEATRVQRL